MPKIILSLCGGGIRGVFTARFLKHLDDSLMRRYNSGICDRIDMVAGTSIGAMIGASFSYERRDGDYLDEMFNKKNSELIMNKNFWDYFFGMFQTRPLYDGKGKRKFIEQEFKNVELQTANIPSLFTGYNVANRKALVFKSWKPCDMELHDVLDVGSAAPSYFPSVKTSTGIIGVDGGIFANNPCIIAYSNALNLFGEDSDIRVISIGTGIEEFNEPALAQKSLRWGAIPWATKGSIIDRLLNAPEDEVHNTMKTLTNSLGHKYFRVNPVLNEVRMDDTSQHYIDYLKFEADKAWDQYGNDILKLFAH